MPRVARSREARESDASIGTAIRRERYRVGMTQQELADAVGMSRSYLAQMERGRKGIYVAWLLMIAEALDADPWDFTQDGK